MCDVFLEVDSILGCRLFRPDLKKCLSRETLAAQEANRCKACLGSLRYLWRNSKSAAHHPKVAELKQLVRLSPTQQSHLDDADRSDAEIPAGLAPRGGGSEVGASSDEAVGDGNESQGGDHEGDIPGDSSSYVPSEDDGDLVGVPPKDEAEVEVSSGDSDTGEVAPSSPVNPNDDEEFPDSQVSSNWLGKAYRDQKLYEAYHREPRFPDSTKEQSDNDDGLSADTLQLGDDVSDGSGNDDDDDGSSPVNGLGACNNILDDIKKELHSDGQLAEYLVSILRLVPLLLFPFLGSIQQVHIFCLFIHGSRHPMLEEYLKHCQKALVDYGDSVYSVLCSRSHFQCWIRSEKAKDC